jgi:hypothetical protein
MHTPAAVADDRMQDQMGKISELLSRDAESKQ